MIPFVLLLFKQSGEHLVDYVGLSFLLGVWTAGILYSDFSGVVDMVVALARLS